MIDDMRIRLDQLCAKAQVLLLTPAEKVEQRGIEEILAEESVTS